MSVCRLPALWDHQVNRFGSDELHIRSRRIEVRIVRNNVTFLASHAEQNPLGGAALMGWDYMPVSENILDGGAEAIKALAAGIAFISLHHGRPLMG